MYSPLAEFERQIGFDICESTANDVIETGVVIEGSVSHFGVADVVVVI